MNRSSQNMKYKQHKYEKISNIREGITIITLRCIFLTYQVDKKSKYLKRPSFGNSKRYKSI